MKPKEIKELLEYISAAQLDEVDIETQEIKLKVKRYSSVAPVVEHYAPAVQRPAVQPVTQIAAAPVQQAAPVTEAKPAGNDESRYVAIKSPMVGTFYRSTSPNNPVLANIGDSVAKGQTVCVIEAMKLFNEIESDVTGKIVKVMVENATPVEYDQVLFLVDPS